MTKFLYESKFGNFVFKLDKGKIAQISFDQELPDANMDTLTEDFSVNETLKKEIKKQFDLYFLGELKSFDLPISALGTNFMKRVWDALKEIPYGKTISYKELAERVGNPKASRAVGGACNKNPIPFIVPCHRVIGSNGKLVGYAGGLDLKSKLLDLEKNK